jgi:hypothetical protein
MDDNLTSAGGAERIKVISIKREILSPVKSSIDELQTALSDIITKYGNILPVDLTSLPNLWKIIKNIPITTISLDETNILEILTRELLKEPYIVGIIKNEKDENIKGNQQQEVSTVIQSPKNIEVEYDESDGIIKLAIPEDNVITINHLNARADLFGIHTSQIYSAYKRDFIGYQTMIKTGMYVPHLLVNQVYKSNNPPILSIKDKVRTIKEIGELIKYVQHNIQFALSTVQTIRCQLLQFPEDEYNLSEAIETELSVLPINSKTDKDKLSKDKKRQQLSTLTSDQISDKKETKNKMDKIDKTDKVSKVSKVDKKEEIYSDENLLKMTLPILEILFEDRKVKITDYMFSLSIIYTLYRFGAQNLLGADSNQILNYKNVLELMRSEHKKKTDEYIKQNEQKYQAQRYYRITREKFGASKLESINIKLLKNSGQILSLLSKKEAHIVSSEFVHKEKEWEALRKNKCDHIQSLNRVKISSQEDLKINLNKLSKFFESTTTDWILCNVCGFRIICKHTYDKFHMGSTQQSISKQIDILVAKYAIKTHGTDNATVETYNYFCKICGEKLADSSDYETQSDMGRMGELEDNIRTTIWSELFFVVPLIRSAFLINANKFANTGANALHTIILQIESDMLGKGKIKSDIGEQIDPKIHLFIIVFIWAYILDYIKHNPHITIQNIPEGSKMTRYMKEIVDIILTRYQHIFIRLPLDKRTKFSSQDYIMEKLMEAYKIISKTIDIEKEPHDEPSKLFNDIILDPIYHYVATQHKLDYTNSANFPKIMNITLPALLKKIKSSSLATSSRGATQTVVTVENNMYANLQEEVAKSKSELSSEIYSAFIKYIKSPHSKEALEGMKKFKDRDPENVALMKQQSMKAITRHLQVTTRETGFQHYYTDIEITYLYDEKGIRHKWSKDAIPKCSICGILITEYKKLNIKTTDQSRHILSKIKMFFGFYEIRCPEGGLHNYEQQTGLCSKCKITNRILKNPTEQLDTAINYYEKYKFTILDIISPPKLEKSPGIAFEEAEVDITTVRYDYAKIKQLANISGVSIHAIESIGRYENRPFNEIESGIKIPNPTIANVLAASAILRLLLIDYYSLKYHNQFLRVQPDIKQFIDANTDKMDQISKLPDFNFANYRINVINDQTPPVDNYQFIIISIVNIFLNIADSSELGKQFVNFGMKKLIHTEKLLSKPGPFNMLVFTQEDEVSFGDEDAIPDDAAETAEDLSANIENIAAQDELTDYEPASLEEMDYDGINEEPA